MRGKDIKKENAMKHIHGYFVGIDFTNRTLQNLNRDFGTDWPMSKGSNGYAAVSDFVPKSAVLDATNIDIQLSINGVTKQKSNTEQLVFDIPTMIADISKYQELREGDLIFTGTPEGIGSVN